MKLEEKIIRKVNAKVQKSGMSKETKLFTENAVLAMDISIKLAELAADSDADYVQREQLNEKLLRILEDLNG